MRDNPYTSTAISFALLFHMLACSGCAKPPPSKSKYAEGVVLNAKREGADLNIELTLPQRADGYIETYSLTVAPEGEQFGRHLKDETSRAQETSNTRSIRTELTDRERSLALDVKVEFSVWKHEGIHRDKELFRDEKVVSVPVAEKVSTTDLR
jgi:hypothetical protein